ncbi:MAG: hypothetical protein WBQ18_04530 [Solirubrobacteraceae bacterium]
MSAISTTPVGASLPATATPPTDAALVPAAIRNGNQTAKNAYQTGLAFEQLLVSQLSQEMNATVSGGSGDGLGGSSDPAGSSGASGGLGGSDSGLGAYSSLLPQTMSQAVMTGGGTGIAMQIARSIDPALNGVKS